MRRLHASAGALRFALDAHESEWLARVIQYVTSPDKSGRPPVIDAMFFAEPLAPWRQAICDGVPGEAITVVPRRTATYGYERVITVAGPAAAQTIQPLLDLMGLIADNDQPETRALHCVYAQSMTHWMRAWYGLETNWREQMRVCYRAAPESVVA